MNEYANQYPNMTPQTAVAKQPELTAQETEKRIRHFHFFSIGSLIYALFYTFCLYKNSSGITYPFFVGGTLFFFFLSLKKLGISAKKDSVFYIVSLLLLGISTFCTDNSNVIFMNKMGIFVLSFVLMLHNFYMDENWDFITYMKRIFRLMLGTIGTIGRPFSDLHLYLEKGKYMYDRKGSKIRYVFLGIIISIPLILFVIVLLSSADFIFDSIMNQIFSNYIGDHFFGICMMILLIFFTSYCMITYLEKRSMGDSIIDRHTGEPVLAITVTSILSAIYLLFSGIQVVYLFFGMKLPYGYTYAQYAREGFFQLLFVCLMNLVLVLICLGRFKENNVLKAVLTIISLCTYIMIASSAMRMIMYIRYYALTFLRIFVLWSLVVITLLMTGVLISIYKKRFPLFKYSMVIVTTLYIGLSFSHPDYWIAKYNITRMFPEESDPPKQERSYSDGYYLSYLSADAAPILLDNDTLTAYYYNDTWLSYYISYTRSHINKIQEEGTAVRTFNLSRYAAQKRIETINVFNNQ